MSAKGAWGLKGGAQLFPQKHPASKKQQAQTTSAKLPQKSSAPKVAKLNNAEKANKSNLNQQPAKKSLTQDGSAQSLATFFVSEQKFEESNDTQKSTIEEWNAYLTDLWNRLRRDGAGCSTSMKTFVRERFAEVLGWTGTAFVASQVVSVRQLEVLFGVLLHHLSDAQNYESNSVVSTNVSLNSRAQIKKRTRPNLTLETVVDGHKSTGEKASKASPQDGGKSGHNHERKGRGRHNKGRNSKHSPGGQYYTGKVTRWGSQGFGFIKPDDGGEDLHVNSSDLLGDFNALTVGGRVVFTKRFNERARKYKACRVSGEACTTTNTLHRSHAPRRQHRRHHRGHRGGNSGYGDNGGNGGGNGNGNGVTYGSNNGISNANSVGFAVPYPMPYGNIGVPFSFGAYPSGGGHFGYNGVQVPPISPTGAPGYGSPPYGGLGYGGPPISPVHTEPLNGTGGAPDTSNVSTGDGDTSSVPVPAPAPAPDASNASSS